GVDLKDVYFAFIDARGDDAILYIPAWQKGKTINLQGDFKWNLISPSGQNRAKPGAADKAIMGPLQSRSGFAIGWTSAYFHRSFTGAPTPEYRDASDGYRRSFPMLSIFGRLAPMRKTQEANRYELMRRDVRDWDLSSAITAGGLAVFARSADNTLPVPLKVNGDEVEGEGDTFIQVVL